jgi:hypothetical protein
MKKRAPAPEEVLALRMALRRAAFAAAVGLAVALIAMALSREFLLMHMALLAAVAVSGGMSCARVVAAAHPPSRRRAGNIGGMAAALAFVVPFIVAFSALAAGMDAEQAGRLAAGLSAAEASELIRQNIEPGVDYFRGQYISYASGYLLFGLMAGFAGGSVGAALVGRRR